MARHLGCDRGTITNYLTAKNQAGVRRPAGPDPRGAFTPYIAARFVDDPHLWATALFDEVVAMG